MGGTPDIWKNSGKSLGLEAFSQKDGKKNETEVQQFKELIDAEQRFDDGKLEFITYQGGLGLGLEKVFKGNGDKVYHGKGPILMKFKKFQHVRWY